MIIVNSKWCVDLLISLSNYRVGNFKSKVLLQQSLIFQKNGNKSTHKKCMILVNSKWFFDLLIRLSNYRVGNFKSKVLLQQSLIFQKKKELKTLQRNA